ncbi:uncharacterized protein LOC121869382 [Homarus americanus]|uniref:uncharacterized protein LOC121869382 n=1 Tax=Homarus americanus TaxID=6706 RepID=UPI001C45451E|nr:uncharacterized protein LOC121869382 [Homarus americanus]
MKVAAAVLCVVVAVAGLPAPQSSSSTEWPIIPYDFGYEVSDAETNNYQNRAEIKLPNGDVFGSYSLLRPDNVIMTVTYNVTGDDGFRYSIVKTDLDTPAS